MRSDLRRGVLGTAGLSNLSGFDIDLRFLGGDLDTFLVLLGDLAGDSATAALDFWGDTLLLEGLLFGVIFFGDDFLGDALLEDFFAAEFF